MSYPVNTEGTKVGSDIQSTNVNLDSAKDCILLDDKPLDLNAVITKIKNILEETSTELGNTQNIDI